MKLEKMKLPESLTNNLHQLEKRWLHVQRSKVLLVSLVLFLASFTIIYLSDRLWDTSSYVRMVLMLLTLVGFLLSVFLYLKKKAIYTKTPFKFIKLVQRHFRFLGDSLQGAVELSLNVNRPASISSGLCDAAINQVAEKTSQLDFTQSVETSGRNRFGRYLAVLLILIALFFALDNRALMSSLERWLNPFGAASRYTFVQFDELPDQMTVIHGEDFSLDLSLRQDSRFKPDKIYWQYSGLKKNEAQLVADKVKLQLAGVTNMTTLAISAYDFSKKIQIKPVHRPAIKDVFATIKMPDYLEHKDVNFKLQGNSFEVLKGSQYQVSGTISNPLSSIQVYQNLVQSTELPPSVTLSDTADEGEESLRAVDNRRLLSSTVSGRSFTTEYSAPSLEEELLLTWEDHNGFTQKEPFTLTVTPVDDEPPFVDARSVGRAFALLVSENIVFPVKAGDNYGVKYIKVEYEVQTTANENYSQIYRRDVEEGNAALKNLVTEFIFSPELLSIPQSSTVKLRFITNDYLPGRKDISSPEYKIYILSKGEHSKLVQERFEAVIAKMEDIAMQEDENRQRNIMIREMSPDELSSEKGQKALEESLNAEKANARQMQEMINQGLELVKEALKNDYFSEDQLKEWTEMLEQLRKLADEDMEAVQKDLAMAGQAEGSSKLPVRIEGLKFAIKKQQEILRQMRKLSKELDEDMKKVTLKNFAARLRSMSKEENRLSVLLQELFVKSVGMTFEKLPEHLKALNDKILLGQKNVNKNLSKIGLEIVDFYARTKIDKYRIVSDDMELKEVDKKLAELTRLIEINKTSVAIKSSKEWAAQFASWADILDPQKDNEPQDPQAQESPKEQDLKFLMALLRTIEQEQNLYEETRFLDDKKNKVGEENEKSRAQIKDLADKLSERQKENLDNLQKLTAQVGNPQVIELMQGAEQAMGEAYRALDKGDVGVKTQAAESAAFELLISIFTSNAGASGSSSAVMAMLQAMMGQGLGSANSSGGNNSGGQALAPTDIVGGPKGGEVEAKNSKKYATAQLEDIPLEFREALESYYKEMEIQFEK